MCLDTSNTKHRETVQDSLLGNNQSDSTQGSVSTGPVGQVGDTPRETSMHQHSGDSRRPQQGEKPQSGPYLLGENFKRLYRVAHCKKEKSFLFYVFSLTLSVRPYVGVCMCVCICFRACMGKGVTKKGKRVQWVID